MEVDYCHYCGLFIVIIFIVEVDFVIFIRNETFDFCYVFFFYFANRLVEKGDFST